MADEPFDIEAALAKKEAETRAAEILRDGQRRRELAWDNETNAVGHISLHRMADPFFDAFRQFKTRGGKIPSGKHIWLPPEHPTYGKVGLDESCMRVPQLGYAREWYAAQSLRREWEAECARIRAEVAVEWDKRFPKVECLEFEKWELEGAHKRGWVVFDERDATAYHFGDRYMSTYNPSVEEVREALVERLYSQRQRAKADGLEDPRSS